MEARTTELIATEKSLHLKLALWQNQKGLTVHEFSKTAWIFLKIDMEDTFELMWFRLEYKKIHYLVFYKASIEIPNTVRSHSFKFFFFFNDGFNEELLVACLQRILTDL